MKINGFLVREALYNKNMQQQELAKITGISRNTISAICHGKSCSRTTAEKIAAALNIDIEELTKV